MDLDRFVELVKLGEIAKQDDSGAQFKLAEAYRVGDVVAHDYAEAALCLKIYSTGLGVDVDQVKATA